MGPWIPFKGSFGGASYQPCAPNVPLLRALWSLLDGIWGSLKGSWGVLEERESTKQVLTIAVCRLSELNNSGSKYPNTQYVPKTITTVPSIGATYTAYLGTLDP